MDLLQNDSKDTDAETLKGCVLAVDDETFILDMISETLQHHGFEVITSARGDEALEIFQARCPDVVLADLIMPGLDGLTLLKQIHELDHRFPVILITGIADLHTAKQAIRAGAYDYITKPFDMADLQLSIARAVRHRRLTQQNARYQKNLEAIVEERTHDLERAMENLQKALLQSRQAHLDAVTVLSKVAELHDSETGNHIRRVSRYSAAIAKALGQPDAFVEEISYASIMHDVGKIAVPPDILKKPARLTRDEFEQVKIHAEVGGNILDGVPFLRPARQIALYHHEHFDGTGYPAGVAGENIPLAARIVTVADVFDALISERCYKKAIPLDEAFKMLQMESGTRFDPDIVNAFLRIQDEIRNIVEELADASLDSTRFLRSSDGGE